MSDPLSTRIAEYIERTRVLDPSEAVLVLVSGGPDSMCLLEILRRVHPGRIAVLTLDHGLRREASRECDLVERWARGVGLEVHRRELELRDGPGLQARARQARRAAASAVAEQQGFDAIALGHTASDQAETVLFRLARGTGRTGAIGMRGRDGRVVRPLLEVTREQTRAWCTEHSIPTVDDPSNGDPRYARVRVRDRLLPHLADVHPGATMAIGRFADQLADEQAVLDDLVDAAWARCAPAGVLRAETVMAEPVAIRRLLVRRALAADGIVADVRSIEIALALLDEGSGRRDVEGGRLEVLAGGLHLRSGTAPPAPGPVTLTVPGVVRFGGRQVRATRAVADVTTPSAVSVRCGATLTVRSCAPGDRIPLPQGGHARVGRLLAAAGVVTESRDAVPVVADGGNIVWVAGYRANPDLIVPPGESSIRLELV